MKLNYFMTFDFWFSLEDYHEHGLLPKETKKHILHIGKSFFGIPIGIYQNRYNNNWIVHIPYISMEKVNEFSLKVKKVLDKNVKLNSLKKVLDT